MNAADVLVKVLENNGCKYIFGIPGEENLEILESIQKSSIKFILTRHEQAAGFMAATVGRLTGSPGVCISTLGPGATNLVTAVAYSQLGAMPVLFITGQKPSELGKQGNFQIINTVEMMKPITKFSKQINFASSISLDVSNAIKICKDERPGAVHLELPEDIASNEVIDPFFLSESNLRRPIAEDKAIDMAIKLIEEATKPVLLIGAGANRKRISKTLTEFVNKTNIPFFTTQMGKGVIDERHPQYLGTAALSENDVVHEYIKDADLIINVGHDTVEKPPFIMDPKNENLKVIHINFTQTEANQIYFPQLEVIGDIANAVWQITEKIKIENRQDDFKLARNNKDKTPLDKIILAIRTAIGEDGILTLDNGLYKIKVSRDYPCYKPNTLLLDNALATMGAGLPSAIASKLVNPESNVITLCGDGGFMMNSQELETAMRLKLDLIVIILKDNELGMIKWKQKRKGYSDFGLNFNNPDFVKYAESYGAKGHDVKDVDNLHEKIIECQKLGGVQLININFNYQNEN